MICEMKVRVWKPCNGIHTNSVEFDVTDEEFTTEEGRILLRQRLLLYNEDVWKYLSDMGYETVRSIPADFIAHARLFGPLADVSDPAVVHCMFNFSVSGHPKGPMDVSQSISIDHEIFKRAQTDIHVLTSMRDACVNNVWTSVFSSFLCATQPSV
jgi:hypothetical protein